MNIPLWPIYSCPFIQISNRCPNQFPPPSLLSSLPMRAHGCYDYLFLPRTLNQIRLRSTLHVSYMWHAYYTYMHEWYPWCVFIHARMDVPLSPLCMLYAHDRWQNNLMNSCVHNVDMFIMLSLCCTVVWPFTTLSLSLVVQIGWYGFCFLDFMTYLRRSNTSNFQSNTLIWMMALTNSDWNNGPS